ncbi:MAG: 50S ribosomal protein L4 [Candidatus Cloacimonetes bacterium]|nr:50S ribosomal protein L4 [Candidatus Cloacimonadota bacterium]
MLEVNKYSVQGEEIGKTELPAELFQVEAKNPKALLYEIINIFRANQRQGTNYKKSRAEVNGSSRKLYRQKGTGNARPGNLRTPLRVGGGNAFGPKNKDWYRKIPKKKKRLALKLALSKRAKDEQVVILESLNFDHASTKTAQELLNKILPENARPLIIIDGSDPKVVKSFSNIPQVAMDRADCIYAYEILKSNYLIITVEALQKMKEVFAS